MNESADIVQEQAAEQLKTSAGELKEKARVAGAAAWDMTKATYQQVQDKASGYGRATDRATRSIIVLIVFSWSSIGAPLLPAFGFGGVCPNPTDTPHPNTKTIITTNRFIHHSRQLLCPNNKTGFSLQPYIIIQSLSCE